MADEHDEGRPALKPDRHWAGLVAVLLLVLLLLTFVLQNGKSVPMRFLWGHFRVPFGVTVLLSAVAGALIAVFLRAGRAVWRRFGRGH